MRPIKNKADFVRRYRAGEFGNAGPTWISVSSWLSECDRAFDKKRYHLRNRNPGGKTHYNLEGWRLWTWATHEGGEWTHNPEWYVSEMAPHPRGTIQGEVRRGTYGLELRYTRADLPMREAFDMIDYVVVGVKSKSILQTYMNHLSYDWLQHLLDEYPDHIVEFSCFEICWGTLPGYNTVFWEVRPDRGLGSNLSSFTEVY